MFHLSPWMLTGLSLAGLAATATTLTSHAAEAAAPKPLLSGMFTDNLILQRDIPVPIWGWTEPGKTVTVRLNGQSAQALADAQGKWMAKLPAMSAGGPFNLVVDGDRSITLTNVLCGDVWLCSGQSNMEMGIGAGNNPQAEIALANYPNIRLFSVPRSINTSPLENLKGQWLPCTPTNVAQGGWAGFSAAAYFFGRQLHDTLHVPIGLIHTSWGGTVAEAWTSADGLQTMPDFAPVVAQLKAAEAREFDFSKVLGSWYQKNDPGTASNWFNANHDTSTWKTMDAPQPWENAGLPDYNGIVWFQKEFQVPESLAGKKALLQLGAVDDMDTTWVNGVEVGRLNDWTQARNYVVPATALKPGRNVITVRVLDTAGAGGLVGKPEELKLSFTENPAIPPIALAGPWRYRETGPLDQMDPVPAQLANHQNNPNIATVLYNGMVAPVVPYGIKGAIWYQGESNVGRARQYQTLLPTLITDWRQKFGVGEFPFYIVQLANFLQAQPKPGESAWAELREAQLLVSQKTPKTGLAVIIDVGDAADIHPKDKQAVGARLALAARATTYGEGIEYSGPLFRSMQAQGSTLLLSFDHANGGLRSRNGEKLQGFAMAGKDGRFVWANATIKGQEVELSAPGVEKPQAVRYGWADNPICNLYNRDGLPASPFRASFP